MITYGKYNGKLKIILRQNKAGFFILDVYNDVLQRFRFTTLVDENLIGKAIIESSMSDIPESIIDALLANVISGTHKRWYWLFAKKIPDDLLKSCVKLVSEKYKAGYIV